MVEGHSGATLDMGGGTGAAAARTPSAPPAAATRSSARSATSSPNGSPSIATTCCSSPPPPITATTTGSRTSSASSTGTCFPSSHRFGEAAGRIRRDVLQLGEDCPWSLRRLKEDLKDLHGRRLFPDRHVHTVRFRLGAQEYAIYKAVTAYINEFLPPSSSVGGRAAKEQRRPRAHRLPAPAGELDPCDPRIADAPPDPARSARRGARPPAPCPAGQAARQ